MEALLEIENAFAGCENKLIDDFMIPDELEFIEEGTEFLEPVATVEHWNEMAIFCMEIYFKDKSFHCGGPIPPKLLFSEKHVTLVRDSVRNSSEGFGNVLATIDLLLHTHSPLRHDVVDIQKPWDIALVIKLMREVQAYNIPKEFVPPLVLLHLHFCKGYKVTDDMIEELLLK